jgi:enoyl-CoA hydratase
MTVHIHREGPLVVITLDRPAVKNAVDREHADLLTAAFRSFEADADASVAILTGANGTFCAGADLKSAGAGAGNRIEPDGDGPMGPTRMRFAKPVIAAIAGYAVAGGLELACMCDLRVVEESATLGVFCRRFGVPLIDGGTVRLPRLIGLSRALDLILTGRAVGAQEALTLGLANRVVPDGTALAAAKELGLAIAAFPQRCLREDRLSAIEGMELDFAAAMDNELAHGMSSLQDVAEGFARFAAGQGRHGAFS